MAGINGVSDRLCRDPVSMLAPMPPMTHPIAAKPLTAAPNATPEVPHFGTLEVTERTTDSFPPRPSAHCWVYVTLNAEIALELPRNTGLRELDGSGRLRTSIDGQWLLWAMRRKYPQLALDKLSGSDLIHSLAAHCAAQGQRLLLLGSTDTRNARAVQRLRARWPQLQVQGATLPWYDPGTVAEAQALLAAVEITQACRAHYVVLGLGAEKEHRLAARLARRLDGQAVGLLCFGGAIDLASGDVPRAPVWLQRYGLEGPWRVWVQPARAWRFVRVLRILPALALGRY